MKARTKVTVYSARTVLPIGAPPITAGSVATQDGRIVAVGPREEVLAAHPAAEEHRFDGVDGVLTPGLINAHTHLNYSHCAHFHDNGKPFADWIQGFPPVIERTTAAGWRESAVTGIAGLLATGTTAAADVVTGAAALTAQHEAGMAGIAYYEVVLHDADSWERARDEWFAELDAASATGATVGISPHTVYTVDSPVLRELGEAARSRGLRLHPHAAETLDEVAFSTTGTGRFADWARAGGLNLALTGKGSGRTPIAELDALGLLGAPTTSGTAAECHIAHGVHADSADRARLATNGTVVALCPRSNQRLESGEAPVAAYRQDGVAVAVGTDSLASTPSLDLLAEVAALRGLARRQGSPEEGLDRWLVEAATRGGARALGRPELGVLRPGARADLAVFEVPTGDPYPALVIDGEGSCLATVLAGELLPAR
jgi:5-methylthioadenosine/S-adenosylhomocysteine deaminase